MYVCMDFFPRVAVALAFLAGVSAAFASGVCLSVVVVVGSCPLPGSEVVNLHGLLIGAIGLLVVVAAGGNASGMHCCPGTACGFWMVSISCRGAGYHGLCRMWIIFSLGERCREVKPFWPGT